jgi:hypothetical protein
MSLHAGAASAQRQQILSRVSSLSFDSTYHPSPASKKVFSPRQYKPTSKRTTIPDSARTTNREHPDEAVNTVEGVTQKLSSTHLRHAETVKSPAAFPQPGDFIGKLGAKVVTSNSKENASMNPNTLTSGGKHSLDGTTHRDQKKRRMNLFNISDGWMLFTCTTPNDKTVIRPLSSRATSAKTKKEHKGSLGNIYDYQLDRLSMKPSERDKYSPMNHTQDEQDAESGEIAFFSPIKCRLDGEQSHEDDAEDEEFNDGTMDGDDTLLTPVEINFDEDSQVNFVGLHTAEVEIDAYSRVNDRDLVFDDDEAPIAALARNYFNE